MQKAEPEEIRFDYLMVDSTEVVGKREPLVRRFATKSFENPNAPGTLRTIASRDEVRGMAESSAARLRIG